MISLFSKSEPFHKEQFVRPVKVFFNIACNASLTIHSLLYQHVLLWTLSATLFHHAIWNFCCMTNTVLYPPLLLTGPSTRLPSRETWISPEDCASLVKISNKCFCFEIVSSLLYLRPRGRVFFLVSVATSYTITSPPSFIKSKRANKICSQSLRLR